jgi:hypothetical protein
MRRQSQFDGSRGHRLTAFLPIAKRIRALLRGLKCQVAQSFAAKAHPIERNAMDGNPRRSFGIALFLPATFQAAR